MRQLYLGLALLLSSHLSAQTPSVPEDFRFHFEVLVGNLAQPMTMQESPDGRIFFHEIAGKVKVIDPQTRLVSVVGEFQVTNAQENGLIGMALDPDFEKNHWIYFLHSPVDYDGQVLSRVTLSDGKLDPLTRKDLLRWPEQREQCCHHAGALRFGPDGCLYISTGDNTNPFKDSEGYAPIDERPDRGPWDAQKSSANTNDLRGKILRIRPTPEGGYSIPEGNLFPKGTPETRPEIYAMGFRNPWRFQIDPKTGYLYVGDVGPDAGKDNEERGPRGFDTLNQVRKPGNFGWPYSRGNRVYSDWDFTANLPGKFYDPAHPENRSPNNTGRIDLPAIQRPLIFYPSADSPEFPILKHGGRTACGGPTFHYDSAFEKGDGLPAYYDGMVIFYDWQRPFIHWLKLDEKGDLKEILPFTEAARVAQGEDHGSGRFQIKRPIDFFFSRDGSLYFLDYGETWGVNPDARLVRMSYQRGNLSPVARASVTPNAGLVPLEITLSSAGSMDREGDPLTYEWKIGDKVVASGPEAKITLSDPGDTQITLFAKDDRGGTGTASLSVIAGNTAPELHFLAPQDGDFIEPSKAVDFRLSIHDVEDGDSTGREAEFAPRTLVTATWAGEDGRYTDADPGLTRMRQSDCFYCHSVGQKLVGPALIDIAKKYKDQSGAAEASVDRVIKGSVNVWGPLPMLPHAQHTADEVHMMVNWIYSLAGEGGSSSIAQGLEGQIAPPKNLSHFSGIVEAIYTDLGHAPAGSISGKASVHLRSRKLYPVQADLVEGPRKRKNQIGAVAHGHYLCFRSMALGKISSVRVNASSGGSGGVIEFRAGATDGQLIGQIEIPHTGGWDQYRDFTTTLSGAPDRADLYILFVNPGKGGLMDIDHFEFLP